MGKEVDMNKKKRILSLLLVFVLIFSACGKKEDREDARLNIVKTNKVEEEAKDASDEDLEKAPGDEKEKEEGPKTINIVAMGDILNHMPVIDSARTGDGFDFRPHYDDIKPIVEKADLAIANFESTMSKELGDYETYPLFNVPDEVADGLKYAGFDVLTTANNHCNDFKRDGIILTIDAIEKAGLKHVGTQKEKLEDNNLYMDVKGLKVAIISVTQYFNGTESWLSPEDFDAMVNPIGDGEKVVDDIKRARDKGADLVIVYPHWGEEYILRSNDYEKAMADKFIAAGADLIFGSHAHVLQEAKMYDKPDGGRGFIIYSMGNAISNQRIETMGGYIGEELASYTEIGVLVSVDVKKEDGRVDVEKVDLIPTWVDKTSDGQGNNSFKILNTDNYLENDGSMDANKFNRIQSARQKAIEVFDFTF